MYSPSTFFRENQKMWKAESEILLCTLSTIGNKINIIKISQFSFPCIRLLSLWDWRIEICLFISIEKINFIFDTHLLKSSADPRDLTQYSCTSHREFTHVDTYLDWAYFLCSFWCTIFVSFLPFSLYIYIGRTK